MSARRDRPRAGSIREPITFLRKTVGTDAFGGPLETWDVLFTTTANVRERTGKETFEAGATTPARRATVRVRATDQALAVTEADRAQVRGQTWAITNRAEVGGARQVVDFALETGAAT